MITSLNIKNLKSIYNFECEFNQLTLLAGINSSGKSTVIHALRMLERYKLGNAPEIPDFGPREELLFKVQNPSSSLEVSNEISVKACFDDGTSSQFVLADAAPQASKKSKHKFIYLGAERLGPRLYSPISYTTSSEFNIGEQGEFTFDCLKTYEDEIIPEALWHPESEGQTLAFNTVAWLNIIAPGYKLDTEKYPQQDIASTTFNKCRPHNVGFGLSYTLPVIVALLGLSALSQSEDYSYSLAIENPEAHLHPKGQTEIGRMIALAATSGLQVIVETHSDYVLDGIRLALQANEIQPDSTTFLFFEKDEAGQSIVQRITANSRGKLSGWPIGFFDQARSNKARLAGL